MVDLFTPRIRLNQQEVGAKLDVWGPDLNSEVTELIEQAVAGKADLDVTAGDILLTAVSGGDDTSRPVILRVIGTPGVPRDITVPDISGGLPVQKFYVLYNASDDTVSLRTVTNTGVTVAVGKVLLLMVDEVLDNVFAISLGGELVIAAANWQTFDADIQGGPPFTTITTRYSSQGKTAMHLIPPWGPHLITLAFGTVSIFPSVSGSPGGPWPEEIVPGPGGFFQAVDGGYMNGSVQGRHPIVFKIEPQFGGFRHFDRRDGVIWTSGQTIEQEQAINAVYPTENVF
jgi:hypothetical protein